MRCGHGARPRLNGGRDGGRVTRGGEGCGERGEGGGSAQGSEIKLNGFTLSHPKHTHITTS